MAIASFVDLKTLSRHNFPVVLRRRASSEADNSSGVTITEQVDERTRERSLIADSKERASSPSLRHTEGRISRQRQPYGRHRLDKDNTERLAAVCGAT